MRKSVYAGLFVGMLGGLLIFGLGSLMALHTRHLVTQYDEQLAALKAQGEPVTLLEVAPKPIPEDQNQAPLLLEAWDRVKPQGQDEHLIELPGSLGPIVAEDLPALEEFVQRNAPSYRIVHEALSRPTAVFPVDWAVGVMVYFPHLKKVRNLTRLEGAGLIVALWRGDESTAIERLDDGLQVGWSINREPEVVSSLVTVACQSIMVRSLAKAVSCRRPSEAFCRQAFAHIVPLDYGPVLHRAIRGERAMVLYTLNPVVRKGLVLDPEEKEAPFYISAWRPQRATIVRDALLYLKLAEQQIALVDQVDDSYIRFQELRPELERLNKDLPRYAKLTGIFLIAAGSWVAKNFETKAKLDATRCGLAVVAFQGRMGKDPTSLDEVEKTLGWKLPLDPGSGKAFKLVREGKLLRVESVLTENAGNGKTRQISFSVPGV